MPVGSEGMDCTAALCPNKTQITGATDSCTGGAVAVIAADAYPPSVGARTHGIYRIWCNATMESYIGKAMCIQRRLGQHFDALRKGVHYNHLLQAAFDRYGESAFDVTILAEYRWTDEENLDGWERFYIEQEQPEFNLKRLRQR